MTDWVLKNLIQKEKNRQRKTLNLIASENYPSSEVLKALASIFTAKYAEGYPQKRYYQGNYYADKLEKLVQKRALKLFHCSDKKWSVNVQPYSGSPANLAIYLALVPLGEKIMGMSLEMGGHLSHGQKVSLTGKLWKQIPYGVSSQTEKLDYEQIAEIAKKEKPKLIIAGYTAYPLIIDFKKFRKIADEVKAILMVDMSHFAGLVAGGVYPSPFPYAEVVMTTTHKTLRGPRAALIFSRNEYSEAINKAVFPLLQGGPHLNNIAAIGIALFEAQKPNFKKYIRQVVKNARILSQELQKLGWRIVSGGTNTHLILIDTMAQGLTGKKAAEKLEAIGIVVNKNTIPYDKRKPFDPSGIRLGTAAVTTRGMKEKEMKIIAHFIDQGLREKNVISLKKEVQKLCQKFPLFSS